MFCKRSEKNLLIVGNQGLGDHLVCNAIYRGYASYFKNALLPISIRYKSSIQQMLMDVKGVRIIPIYNNYVFRQQQALLIAAERLGFSTLQLGHTDPDFSDRMPGMLDEYFYRQAALPIAKRWDDFNFVRNAAQEKSLIERTGIQPNKPFLFLHEDKSRGFLINRRLVSRNLTVVEPNPDWGFTIFDYTSLLLGANEIHCIESSFSIFVDSLKGIGGKLYAHRYARPEIHNDDRHEIGYRKNWEILY